MNHPIKNPKLGFTFHRRYPWTWYFIRKGLAGKQHGAWDYLCPVNTPVYAPGRLQQARIYTDQVPGGRQHPDFGRCIYAYSLDNPELTLVFAHLMAVGIPRVGKIWQKDEIFAWSGNTGVSTAPHLHFEIRKNNVKVDPALYIK